MVGNSFTITSSEIADAIPGGFFIYQANEQETLVYANSELIRIYGCESLEELKQLTNNSFRGFVHPDDLEWVEDSIKQQISISNRGLDYVEYRIVRKDGEVRWVEDFGHLMHNDVWGDIFYVFISDITEKKKRIQSVVEQAKDSEPERDHLTGLYTREYFYQYAARIIEENPGSIFAILASDIENFKFINEKYGTRTGDDILQNIARQGPTHIPGYMIGGRLDGDRFVALIEKTALPDEMVWNSIQSMHKDVDIPNLSLKHGIYYLNEPIPVSMMCTRAFLALDSVKGVYGRNIGVYNDEIRLDWIMKQQILDNADTGLQNGQFLVYYQPKYSLHSNRTEGAEALVRWIHPEFGFMNPAMFVPLFEKNGFITQMDRYILESVCEAIASWKEKGIPVVPISVNISRKDFEYQDLPKLFMETLARYELDPSLIHIELTETCYVDNPSLISQSIRRLHDAGVVIELDDFGSGYSSLTALSGMPLDIMKIDMSIIREDIPDTEKNILEFTMQLARMMKLKTVQEGVETKEQLERVRELGCDYVQGYYISRPMPQKDFEEYLRAEARSF